jgi:DNA-binding transcriptional LysR family regulator
MEWQQLLGFSQVAKLGSFTRAAAATFRTQPALTQQVKALEEEWGLALLERIGRRRLRLTPAGERVLAFATAVLRDYAVLQEDLAALKGEHAGRLRLAAPFTTLHHLLPAPLTRYREQFPRVELTILDRSQPEVLALVKNGDVDLGLALASLIPAVFETIPWQEVHTVLLAPRDHPLAARRRFSLKDIAAYPLILPPAGPSSAGRARLEELFSRAGLAWQVVMESSNVELSAAYVERGLGLSFATVVRRLTGLAGRNLTFLPLDRFFKPDHLCLVLRRDKVLPAYQQAFVKMLLEKQPD